MATSIYESRKAGMQSETARIEHTDKRNEARGTGMDVQPRLDEVITIMVACIVLQGEHSTHATLNGTYHLLSILHHLNLNNLYFYRVSLKRYSLSFLSSAIPIQKPIGIF